MTDPIHPHASADSAANPAAGDAVQTVAFVSLGCPKNLVDSEKMLGLLAEDGLLPISDEAEADALVVNTCGFLEASKDESLGVIQEAAERKRSGKLKRLVVAGCLVQRHRAKMLDWCPDIDALIGVFDRDRIVQAVRPATTVAETPAIELPVYSSIAANATIALQQRADASVAPNATPGYFESDAARLRLTPRHYAYLRVSEGCNQNCAFCTIPSIRGKMRSKPADRIVDEVRELMADGAFELNLIGQDTTSYGEDIEPGELGIRLPQLLRRINDAVDEFGGGWARLMYAYPSCFTDEMIDAIAELPHIVKYIDMPLQHINDRVLDSMRRLTSRALIEDLLEKLRDRVPGIAIRTTFISGFPGETEAEHDELVEFVDTFGFDAMGVFPYSPEPGTPAGTLHASGGAVPPEVIEKRIDELMLTQQDVIFERNAAQAEALVELDVLIDAAKSSEAMATAGVGRGGRLYEGRAYFQAPQIDGLTYVQSEADLVPGELVRCRVMDYDGYDLIARPVKEVDGNVSLPVMG